MPATAVTRAMRRIGDLRGIGLLLGREGVVGRDDYFGSAP
jgi:hypothetical protein